ncbi:MAG: WecB/TagA/CpsF family glycosyltransferase [Clostridia bacterium]|nr:WecB/TagA/CpsF family glycosyltransferase [Clostridia bacterium]
MDKINILGVNISNTTMVKALEKAEEFLKTESFDYIFTPNSEIIMSASEDKAFCDIINTASMLTADGIGVIYASRILNSPLPERVAGFDLTVRLLESIAKSGKTAYFFGGAPGVADEAKEKLEKKYPEIKIVGTANGFFDEKKEKEIIQEINDLKPDLLLVCLGCPKQEKWIYNHKDELSCCLAMGVGGTLDVIAGKAKRAPDIFIKFGLEWFYRLIKQPTRFVRMLALPKFLLKVIGYKFSQKKGN